MSAVKEVIVAPGVSKALSNGAVAYFASFSGTSYTARLEVEIQGDWLPATADFTQAGNMTTVLFAGRPSDTLNDPLMWRWNVTAITGTLTVYIE